MQKNNDGRIGMTGKPEKDMVIYLSGEAQAPAPAPAPEPPPSFDELTPREIVAELDKYIVGQNAAKRAVAVALRNRVRRQKLQPEMAEDVLPKNILMTVPPASAKRKSPAAWRASRAAPSSKLKRRIYRSRLRRPRR